MVGQWCAFAVFAGRMQLRRRPHEADFSLLRRRCIDHFVHFIRLLLLLLGLDQWLLTIVAIVVIVVIVACVGVVVIVGVVDARPTLGKK